MSPLPWLGLFALAVVGATSLWAGAEPPWWAWCPGTALCAVGTFEQLSTANTNQEAQ